MDKIIKVVATIIVVIMVASVLVNASILFIGYAGFSLASVIYGTGVVAMFGVIINEYINRVKILTIESIISIAVLSTLSFLGVAWYLFGTLPACGIVRNVKVITFKDKE